MQSICIVHSEVYCNFSFSCFVFLCLRSQCCNRAFIFCLVCRGFCLVPSVRRNTERMLTTFAGGSHTNNRLNDYTFLAKLEQEQNSRIQDKIRIDANRTGADAQRMNSQILLHKQRSRTQFHVDLKISLTNFV